ncbi:MAG TPA: hypothetical protein VIG82_08620 [Enteractinococcus sp.]
MNSDNLFANDIMNSATFKIVRQFLGLTAPEVARACHVTLRTARRWESSHTPPRDAVQWLHSKWDEMSDYIDATMQELESVADSEDYRPIAMTAYRTDADATDLPPGVSKEQHAARLGLVLFLANHRENVDIKVTFAGDPAPTDGQQELITLEQIA